MFVACTAIWGSTWLAITFQLGVVASAISVAYRFALAAAILASWCLATGRSLRFAPRAHGLLAAQGALMFGLNYVAVYRAEEYIASGLVAVLFSTIVFTNALGARIAFGESLTVRTIIGATLGVAGVSLLFLPDIAAAGASTTTVLGVGYSLAAALLATGGNLVTMRMQRSGLPIFPTTAWGMAYGAIVAAVVASLSGVTWSFDPHPAYIVSLMYLAVFGSIVAFGAYLTLLKAIGAGPSAFIAVSTPVVAMLLSTAVEGYVWSVTAAAGVALAVAGNIVVLRQPRGRVPTRAVDVAPGPRGR